MSETKPTKKESKKEGKKAKPANKPTGGAPALPQETPGAQGPGKDAGTPTGQEAGEMAGAPMSQGGGEVTGAPVKSKAEGRAERRAKQEAQRAAKAQAQTAAKSQAQTQKQPGKPKVMSAEPKPPTHAPAQNDRIETLQDPKPGVHKTKLVQPFVVEKRMAKKSEVANASSGKVQLFGHLDQYRGIGELMKTISIAREVIHPEIIALGLKYAHGVIRGSNARCIALLKALRHFIIDYVTPVQKELLRDLDQKLKPQLHFLKLCRPLSISMGNAVRYLKKEMIELSERSDPLTDVEVKKHLITAIDSFINNKIILADRSITLRAKSNITNGDVILTYGYSSVVRQILVSAFKDDYKFHVIVVDSRPRFNGRRLLQDLVQEGVKCTYVLINSLSFVMREATKVFLGAHCLQANGSVMSDIGTSQVALMANAYNKPVLVCCETYKFCRNVQTDSIVVNELANPEELARSQSGVLCSWKDLPNLSLLNLMYDVTPEELVTAIITEQGMIPCTSVPVVLRMTDDETKRQF